MLSRSDVEALIALLDFGSRYEDLPHVEFWRKKLQYYKPKEPSLLSAKVLFDDLTPQLFADLVKAAEQSLYYIHSETMVHVEDYAQLVGYLECMFRTYIGAPSNILDYEEIKND
jgi:hypothetical protein